MVNIILKKICGLLLLSGWMSVFAQENIYDPKELLFSSYLWYPKRSDVPVGPGDNRITSYNVCYTKLLRLDSEDERIEFLFRGAKQFAGVKRLPSSLQTQTGFSLQCQFECGHLRQA